MDRVPFQSDSYVRCDVAQNGLHKVYEDQSQFKDLTDGKRTEITGETNLQKETPDEGEPAGTDVRTVQYEFSGLAPIILRDEHGEHERFSACNYSDHIVTDSCKTLYNRYMETQTLYQEAIKFATAKHLDQDHKVPGTNLPYVVHLSNVAMEIMIASCNTDNFNLGLAVQAALLHDTLEDTSTDFAELESKFGSEVATAVSALTKNNDLPKEQSMADSLARIKEMPSEVWAVKLSDRITNLQPPPAHWNNERRIAYREEAKLILSELKEGNEYLTRRLEKKIDEYQIYITN